MFASQTTSSLPCTAVNTGGNLGFNSLFLSMSGEYIVTAEYFLLDGRSWTSRLNIWLCLQGDFCSALAWWRNTTHSSCAAGAGWLGWSHRVAQQVSCLLCWCLPSSCCCHLNHSCKRPAKISKIYCRQWESVMFGSHFRNVARRYKPTQYREIIYIHIWCGAGFTQTELPVLLMSEHWATSELTCWFLKRF